MKLYFFHHFKLQIKQEYLIKVFDVEMIKIKTENFELFIFILALFQGLGFSFC